MRGPLHSIAVVHSSRLQLRQTIENHVQHDDLNIIYVCIIARSNSSGPEYINILCECEVPFLYDSVAVGP